MKHTIECRQYFKLNNLRSRQQILQPLRQKKHRINPVLT